MTSFQIRKHRVARRRKGSHQQVNALRGTSVQQLIYQQETSRYHHPRTDIRPYISASSRRSWYNSIITRLASRGLWAITNTHTVALFWGHVLLRECHVRVSHHFVSRITFTGSSSSSSSSCPGCRRRHYDVNISSLVVVAAKTVLTVELLLISPSIKASNSSSSSSRNSSSNNNN